MAAVEAHPSSINSIQISAFIINHIKIRDVSVKEIYMKEFFLINYTGQLIDI